MPKAVRLLSVALFFILLLPRVHSLPTYFLEQEEALEQARQAGLEDWCSQQLAGQVSQRQELEHASSELSSTEEGTDVSDVEAGHSLSLVALQERSTLSAQQLRHRREEVARQSLQREAAASALQVVDRKVAALSAVEQKLAAAARGGGEMSGLLAVRHLLSSAEAERLRAAAAAGESSGRLQLKDQGSQEVALLEAEHMRLAEELAQRHARRSAAHAGEKVRQDAAVQAQAMMEDVQSVCSLGRNVLQRLKEKASPLRESALQLMMQVEVAGGSAGASPVMAYAGGRMGADMVRLSQEAAFAAAPGAPAILPVPSYHASEMVAVPAYQPFALPFSAQRMASRPAMAEPLAVAAAATAAARPEQVLRGSQPSSMVFGATEAPIAATAVPEEQTGSMTAKALLDTDAEDSFNADTSTSVAATSGTTAAATAAPLAPTTIKAVVAQAITQTDAEKADAKARNKVALASVSEVEPMEATVKHHAVGGDLAAEDTEGPMAEATRASGAGTATESNENADEGVSLPTQPVPSSWPSALRGGWQALLKQNNKKKRQLKHATHDEASQIMDLVQTPGTYTAWTPDSSDVDTKKSELLAAEQAFDSDDSETANSASRSKKPKRASSSLLQLGPVGLPAVDEEADAAEASSVDGTPWSFLQKGRETSSRGPGAAGGRAAASDQGSRAKAAAMVLEEFAQMLSSEQLLQLSQSDLSLPKLKEIWSKVQTAEQLTRAKGHEDSKASQLCRDLQREAAGKAQDAHEAEVKQAVALAQAKYDADVLSRELAARHRVAEVINQGTQNLLILKGQLQQQAMKESTILAQLREEAQLLVPAGGAAPAALAALFESLGQLESLASASDSELQDAVAAALARRAAADRSGREELEKLRAKLKNLKHTGQHTALVQIHHEAETDLQQRLSQMCQTTLEEFEAQQGREEAEKSAIRCAMEILAS